MIPLSLRIAALLILFAVLQGCATTQVSGPFGSKPAVVSMQSSVPRYDVFEIELRSRVVYENPFRDVAVRVAFVAPDGRERVVRAFHDGGDVWRARFAPDLAGHWSYRSSASNTQDNGLHAMSGTFDCNESTSKGFIRVAPSHDRFAFDDGSRFYGLGDTAYGLVAGVSNEQLTAYLDKRRAQRFNFIRLFAAGFPSQPHKSLPESQSWPWGGTPTAPDFDRVNPEFMRRLEQVIGELKQRGMFAEVLVFNYYTPPFTDPKVWTSDRESLWAEQVISRLAAFNNVFLWTVTNEYETYPTGKYRYEGASDDDWAIRMGALFHELDPFGHPVTTHHFSFDSDGGIGSRFGRAPQIDVLTQQQWGRAVWKGEYLDGDAEGIERAIAVDRVYDKPVINTENGYEWLREHSNFNRQTVTADKARRAAWRIFAAGGATSAAGFAGTWHGSDDYHWQKDGPLQFKLHDMGFARQVHHLADFISAVRSDELEPQKECVSAPNLCLAAPGEEYVVYAPVGGSMAVDLTSQSGKRFKAVRFNPATGQRRKLGIVNGGAIWQSADYGVHDWVLHLLRVKQ